MILSYIYIILGILFLIYTVVLAFGAHGSMFFIIWGMFGIIGIAVGILRLKGCILPRIPLIIVRSFIIALLVLFVFVEALIFTHFHKDTGEKSDYLIVAGAQVIGNQPSPVLRYRLDTALEYLRKYPETICIVTGGKGSNETKPEAVVMADYLASAGIDRNRILLEDKSTNTVENMKNATELYDLNDRSVAIVSSNFHVYRCLKIAQKQGMKHVNGIAAHTTTLYLPNNLLREFFGVCKDFLWGNM